LNIFVWRNPEVSTTVIVRPDGMINAPLVEDIKVSEKTPSQVARDIEDALRTYIKNPLVSVAVDEFEGPYKEQVRVIGAAAEPQSLPYNEDMTLLDLIIAVGGLTEFADGNKAVLARIEKGDQMQYTIRIEDLVQSGDLSANIDILPGDIVIIPEAWY
jgi:polysaccharide export outer membrane protein